MKTLLITISLLLAACGGGSSIIPGGSTSSVPNDVKRIWDASGLAVPIAKDVKQTTPRGVTVYSRAGLSQDFLTQADAALEELFADVQAAYPGQADPYSLNYMVYDIYEPNHDCVPSPEMRVPSFYVKDTKLSYDGSQFDQYNSQGPGVKDGKSVVMAPEEVFSMTTMGSTIEGVPNRRARMLICADAAHWKNSVRYGAEHNVGESAANISDSALFQLALANRIHTTGGHPFVPSRVQGFKAVPREDWSEFAPKD